jgi:hypothetical protein
VAAEEGEETGCDPLRAEPVAHGRCDFDEAAAVGFDREPVKRLPHAAFLAENPNRDLSMARAKSNAGRMRAPPGSRRFWLRA